MPTTDDLAALLVECSEQCAPDRDNVLNALNGYATPGHRQHETRLPHVPGRRVHRVHRLLATAAAVVVAVGVGVGVETLYSRSDDPIAAGGAPITACQAALPTAWQHAFDTGKIVQPGQNTQPLVVTNGGAVILSWTGANGDLHVGRLTPGRNNRPTRQDRPARGNGDRHL